ncbi:MAG: aminotransferase class V-fold PLP-dependent enzyme, partial [Nanoarchaeota archaeon]
EKLAGYIGIGSQNVIKIATDENGRMRTGALQLEIERAKRDKKKILAVVATAGTTGCGAIDPLAEIADITEREQIYFHVDAAHGGGFLTSQRMRPKFNGIERADSVTIDGHKMLYTNYPCGGIVFKNKLDPVESLKQSAKYILDKASEHYNLGKSTVEGSRSTDGTLQLYASILALGRQGYELIADHTVNMTEHLLRRVKQSPVLEAFHQPEMNLLCFRYVPQGWDRQRDIQPINQANVLLNQEIYRDGEFYLGETEMKKDDQECKVQRAIIMHPYVEKYDIDRLVRRVEELGEKVTQEMGMAK